MHMYKLRLRAIIGAFNKKRCIILTFKSGGTCEYRREYEYFPCPNTTLFGQIIAVFIKVVAVKLFLKNKHELFMSA